MKFPTDYYYVKLSCLINSFYTLNEKNVYFYGKSDVKLLKLQLTN